MREKVDRARHNTKAQSVDPLVTEDLVDFITSQMYIPETGKALDLHHEQAAVLNAMNARDAAGSFLYSTWMYSAPKKSAKTTIGAGVALWQAWRIPYGEIYIIGNDLKQADNRMAQAIRYCVEHNPAMRERAHVTTSKYKIELDNGTRIEAIPVDPRGEAGMNPTGLFWTEAWGAVGKASELLWTEAALSPTRAGQSFKFVDSYAGFSGESALLERLYEATVKGGVPDPLIPELYRRGGSIAYWCTRRFLDWQTNDAARAYYIQEEIEKTPQEFARIHGNEWQTATQAFVPPEWWDACRGELPLMGERQQMVLALDAAVSGDCFAMVGVSKHDDRCAVRFSRIWTPPKGGKLNYGDDDDGLEDTPWALLRTLTKGGHIALVTYDQYQLHDFMSRVRRKMGVWCDSFDQGAKRLIADKQLYDMIRDRRIVHDGTHTDLTAHVKNADRKPEGERLRIVKRKEELKIDANVALSMAANEAMRLNV